MDVADNYNGHILLSTYIQVSFHHFQKEKSRLKLRFNRSLEISFVAHHAL